MSEYDNHLDEGWIGAEGFLQNITRREDKEYMERFLGEAQKPYTLEEAREEINKRKMERKQLRHQETP